MSYQNPDPDYLELYLRLLAEAYSLEGIGEAPSLTWRQRMRGRLRRGVWALRSRLAQALDPSGGSEP